MKQLEIGDAETMILALQDEIRRSDESRYDHRLHGVSLVAQGISGREAAGVLGAAPRTVETRSNTKVSRRGPMRLRTSRRRPGNRVTRPALAWAVTTKRGSPVMSLTQ